MNYNILINVLMIRIFYKNNINFIKIILKTIKKKANYLIQTISSSFPNSLLFVFHLKSKGVLHDNLWTCHGPQKYYSTINY